MKVYHGVEEFVAPEFPIVTTGTFDGVHTGHMEILNRLKTLAKQHHGESVVVSFDPHPRTVIHPDFDTQLIHTIDEKIDRLEKAGIDHFVIIPFTLEFSRTTSLSFVRDILIRKLHTKILVIGYDHQFGRNREGSIEDLEEYSRLYDFEIEQIPVQTFEDINISSTKIRHALAEGNIDRANKYLGYDFLLTGEVIHGHKLGKTMGFPTANIEINNGYKLVPVNGVYAVEVGIGNQKYGGMLNIGSKPTVTTTDKRSIEVHIFEFNGNLYGSKITIHFKRRIRSEQKFNGLEELRAQLQKDQLKALEILHR